MKAFFLRSQLIFVAQILLLTFGLTMNLVIRFNSRTDLTPGKMYSIAEATQKALGEMRGPVEVEAFYPQDDPARQNFEVFLKQCRMIHNRFRYNFYDPDRVPSLTKQYKIKDLYTVILRFQNRFERIVQPTEQSFTNALVRLLHPQKLELCFVTGHAEAQLDKKDRNGYSAFSEILKENNYGIQTIILNRDKVPAGCQVVVIPGPHHDLDAQEFQILMKTFQDGKGILFLVDPMDTGEGKQFVSFAKQFGVELGSDVIVDKASRMVGGDFLVTLVNQYVMQHPVTRDFQQPTFFPVTRSVQPSVDLPKSLEAVPLSLSSPDSWAETNLALLEKGEATFDSSYDLLGPIPVAVAVESKKPAPAPQPGNPKAPALRNKPSVSGGRIVFVGDSDFLTNAYIDLSGNVDFALNAIQWLAKDDRFIMLRPRDEEFRPLLLNRKQKIGAILFAAGLIPAFFLVLGFVNAGRRKKYL